MTLPSLLHAIHTKGIALAAADGRLTFDAPHGAVTDDLRDALKTHKPTLLRLFGDLAAKIVLAETLPIPGPVVAMVEASSTPTPTAADCPTVRASDDLMGSQWTQKADALLASLPESERRAELWYAFAECAGRLEFVSEWPRADAEQEALRELRRMIGAEMMEAST